MNRALCMLLCLLLTLSVAPATPVRAQDFPTKMITIVAPFPAGGTTDAVARPLAQQFQRSMGQTVIVENKGGAGGSIGTAAVARGPADGYTQLIVFDTHAVNPHIYKKLPFDTFKDLTGVSQIVSVPQVLVVPASFPANSVKDLVQLAKSKPGSVTYASAGPGSSNQLTAELFARTAGIQMSHVPYKGGGPMVTDLVGAHVNVAFISQPLVLAHIRAGKLKALAVTSDKRSALLPDVPTVAEQGYPGVQCVLVDWLGGTSEDAEAGD